MVCLKISPRPAAMLIFVMAFSTFSDPVFVIEDSVLVDNTVPIGINLSDDQYWDNPILKKHNNQNFEGSMYRQCITGEVLPGGFLATSLVYDKRFQNNWKKVLQNGKWWVISGVNKWTNGVIENVQGREHNGETRPLFILNKQLQNDPASALLVEGVVPDQGAIPVNKNNEFRYDQENVKAVSGDVSPETFGVSALQMDGSNTKTHYRVVGHANDSKYNIEGTWKVSFYAKIKSGNAGLSISTGGTEKSVPLTGQWKQYNLEFDIRGTPKLWFTFFCTGGVVLLDDIYTMKMESGNPKNKTVFLDQMVEVLKQMNAGLVRYLRMGGQSLENTIRPPLQSYAYDYNPWDAVAEQTGRRHQQFSLHEFYELCELIGAEPWFSLPGTITREEVSAFMEYLAAPATVGLGALRAELGHPQPWTDVFREIHVEFGNEVHTFEGANFAGPDYWNDLILAGKHSPHYRPKIKFRIGQVGAWHAVNRHTATDYVSISTYRIFNLWESDFQTHLSDKNDRFRWLFSDPFYAVREGGKLKRDFDQLRETQMQLTVYEGNYHTTFGDASLRHYNSLVSSIGGAVSYANGMMVWMQDVGMRRQCFFNLAQNHAAGFTNHNGIDLWGAYLSLRPDSLRTRPLGITLEALNKVVGGDMLQVLVRGEQPTFEATGRYEEGIDKKKDELETLHNLPVLNVYAFRKNRIDEPGAGMGAVLVNLDLDSSRTVSLEFEGQPDQSLAQMWQTRAPHIEATNEYEDLDGNPQVSPPVYLADSTIVDFSSGWKITLPPYSLTTLSWNNKTGSGLTRPSGGALAGVLAIHTREGIRFRFPTGHSGYLVEIYTIGGQRLWTLPVAAGKRNLTFSNRFSHPKVSRLLTVKVSNRSGEKTFLIPSIQ